MHFDLDAFRIDPEAEAHRYGLWHLAGQFRAAGLNQSHY
jgi:hypothetical protein